RAGRRRRGRSLRPSGCGRNSCGANSGWRRPLPLAETASVIQYARAEIVSDEYENEVAYRVRLPLAIGRRRDKYRRNFNMLARVAAPRCFACRGHSTDREGGRRLAGAPAIPHARVGRFEVARVYGHVEQRRRGAALFQPLAQRAQARWRMGEVEREFLIGREGWRDQ